MRRSGTRRFAAWLALAAIALNGLWPLLANAAPRDFAAPICSMVGTTTAVDATGTPLPAAPAKSPAPHCPFCTTGSDYNPGLATAETVAFAVPESMPQPLVSGFVPESSFVVLAAPPRGPPSRLI